MKNILILLCAFVLVGAGCLGSKIFSGNEVEGDWVLAFDLPQGWVMAKDYDATSPSALVNQEIDSSLSDIIIQSTEKAILEPGKQADYSLGLTENDFVSANYTYIRAFRLDGHRIIPSEAEDLGGGFSVISNDDGTSTYYLETDGGKYQFMVLQNGNGGGDAERVIFSAKEVTSHITE
ncbi:hypothetical protein KJ766_01115 [Patescibacteria group bacterium]|nr:hypothetical protein [Patescibacteria group bacterium]